MSSFKTGSEFENNRYCFVLLFFDRFLPFRDKNDPRETIAFTRDKFQHYRLLLSDEIWIFVGTEVRSNFTLGGHDSQEQFAERRQTWKPRKPATTVSLLSLIHKILINWENCVKFIIGLSNLITGFVFACLWVIYLRIQYTKLSPRQSFLHEQTHC